MLVGERSDLHQGRYAQYHLGPRELLQFLAHRFGGTSTNAAVNFVEDESSLRTQTHPLARNGREGWGAPVSARAVVTPPAGAALLNAGLQRQHHPRQFTARRDLLDRAKWLSGIGEDQVLHLVEALRAPVPFFIRAADLGLEARLHGQLVDLALDHLFQ